MAAVNARLPILLLLLLVLGLASWYGLRGSSPGSASASATNSGSAQGASSSSAGLSTQAESGSKIIVADPSAAPGRLQGPAPSTTPAASRNYPATPEGRRSLLADLQTRGSFAEAMREAMSSSDPTAKAFLGELVAFCMLFNDPKAQAMLNDDKHVPARMRSSKTPFKTPIFPTPADEAQYRDNTRAIKQFCAGFDAKAAMEAEAAAAQQLSAAGSTYAALGQLLSGRVNFTGLNAAQFDVIAKALEEGNIGTLALLGFQAQPMLNNYVHAANAQIDGARTFGQSTGIIAWQLALCQMGAYCGGDSLWARDACFRFGACGPDLATGIRRALERDGIDPDALERVASHFLDGIRSKDPTRLNFRKGP